MKQRAGGFGSLAITIQRTSQQQTSDLFKSIGERIRPSSQLSSAGMIEKLPNQSGHSCVCANLTHGPRQHGLAGQAPQSGAGLFCFLSIDSIVVFIAYNVAHNVFAKLRSVPASWLWTFGWVCNSQQRAINTYTGFNTSYPVSHCVDACFCWVCLDDYLEFRFTTL